MSIKWRVENVTVERADSTSLPVVDVNLSGYVDSSRDVSPYSLAGLGRMVESKLNVDPQEEVRAKFDEATERYYNVLSKSTIASVFGTLSPMQKNAVYKLIGLTIEEEKRVMKNHYDYGKDMPKIKNVVFNDPATIVFWSDNTKTVVKCKDGDAYDPEKGLTMAITKKIFGNKGNYYNEIKKWLPEEPAEEKQTVIGRVTRVGVDQYGVNAYIDLYSSVDADKLVKAIKDMEVKTSMEFVCDKESKK